MVGTPTLDRARAGSPLSSHTTAKPRSSALRSQARPAEPIGRRILSNLKYQVGASGAPVAGRVDPSAHVNLCLPLLSVEHSRRVVSYGCVVLDNFSVAAQRVVSLATMEARRLDHPRVGTEHLLLGALSDDDGELAEVLRAAGVSLAAARHKVVEALGAGTGLSNSGALPFTPRAQRALERAGRFSRKQQEPEVTVGHVLLGVLDVEGLACQVLRGLGMDIDHVREAFVTTRVDIPAVLAYDQPSIKEVRPWCPNCHALLDDTLSETLISARRDGAPTTNVSVAFCAACGTTLGVVRPESS